MGKDFKKLIITAVLAFLPGCGGYTNSWLHRTDVTTVYVEMFESDSFRRGYEYLLTDAICKQIEAQTPYKIVTDRNLADTELSGSVGIGQGVISGERWTGTPLELESMVSATVTWKNLKTGQLLIQGKTVYGSAGFSGYMGQSFDYAVGISANRAAQKVVELMEQSW